VLLTRADGNTVRI